MRAALYARVSTEDQATEGFSLDAQMKRLESFCAARGWEVVARYRDEGFSGRSTDRPAYMEMMSNLDSWDTVVVLKMDRIHRNSMNFTQMMTFLNENGKDFNSVMEKFDTSTAMGRFVMDTMQRIAQLESEQTGERVKLAMTYKAESGNTHLGSGHPFGYAFRDGRLEVVEEEAAVVRTIFSLRIRGTSAQGIADFLNRSGIPTKKGRSWARQTVMNVLANPLYAGFYRWNGIVRKGDQDAIVGVGTFEAVNGSLMES